MSNYISEILERLRPDPWRVEVGFSPELEAAHEAMFKPQISEADLIAAVAAWLQRHQPCLFGRIAAKLGLLSYCILTDADLHQSDHKIKEKIQSARLQWTRDAYEGKKSGFVILAVSNKLASALPNADMKEFARRLCFLYLETEVEFDAIHIDEIFLEQPGRLKTTWRWPVGVNYFAAQGDKRWWQDHRIPGGIGFSMNSVGHMVKSGMLATAMKGLEELMGSPDEGWTPGKVESLDKALEMAMRTIFLASEAVSGKATELLQLPTDIRKTGHEKCPVDLPPFLADKNFCEYKGWYHTDYTLPSEYFVSNIERSAHTTAHTLDFTYLFRNDLENPDHETIGKGHRVRAGFPTRRGHVTDETRKRQNARKLSVCSVPVNKQTRLIAALKNERKG